MGAHHVPRRSAPSRVTIAVDFRNPDDTATWPTFDHLRAVIAALGMFEPERVGVDFGTLSFTGIDIDAFAQRFDAAGGAD